MLSGKVVVITGAASGIGRSLALELADRDVDVWALDINAEALTALAEKAKENGGVIQTICCDVTQKGVLDQAALKISSLQKRLDYWINNAGIGGIGGFLETSADQFQRVLDINLHAVINGTRAALKIMEEAGSGKVINMASVAGHLPAPYMSAYNASKFGVVGFTRALQEELRLKASPVKMLLVSPGFVDTRIISKGAELGFPEWMSFMLSTPNQVAKEIVKGMTTSKEELYPTLNGRMIRRMHKLFPTLTVRSSKILLTRSFKDVLLKRYITR